MISFELLFNYNFRFNHIMLSAFPALLKAETHLSTCYKLCPALNWTLILASPLGTTGKLNPITKIFYSSILFDNSVAILASPSQTGAIGHWSCPKILNPAAFILVLKSFVLEFSWLIKSLL